MAWEEEKDIKIDFLLMTLLRKTLRRPVMIFHLYNTMEVSEVSTEAHGDGEACMTQLIFPNKL